MNNNEMKNITLSRITSVLDTVSCKLVLLEALDRDQSDSGYGDLTDQIATMRAGLATLQGAVSRAESVVPSTNSSSLLAALDI